MQELLGLDLFCLKSCLIFAHWGLDIKKALKTLRILGCPVLARWSLWRPRSLLIMRRCCVTLNRKCTSWRPSETHPNQIKFGGSLSRKGPIKFASLSEHKRDRAYQFRPTGLFELAPGNGLMSDDKRGLLKTHPVTSDDDDHHHHNHNHWWCWSLNWNILDNGLMQLLIN